jgi:hypothetical protein
VKQLVLQPGSATPAAAAAGSADPQAAAAAAVQQPLLQPSGPATAPWPLNRHSRSRSSSGRCSVTPFAIEQQLPGGPMSPAAAAAVGAVQAGRTNSSSSSSIKRSTSEPSLQQWASDGLQSLGEPSWVKLSRSSEGGSAAAGGSGSVGRENSGSSGSSGSAGAGGVGDIAVHALESDLKKTARLYPPGR